MASDGSDGVELTPEQMAAHVREAAIQAEAEAASAVLTIESMIADFDSFDLLTWFAFANLNIDPNDYTEAGHQGSAAKVEYLTLQSLRLGRFTGGKVVMDGDEFEALNQALDKVFVADWMADMGRALQEGGAGSLESELPSVARRHEQFVRAMGYPVHLRQILRRIFSPVQADLERILGFDVEIALQLDEAIADLISERMSARAREVRSVALELAADIRKARTAGDSAGDVSPEMKAWLRLDQDQVESAIRGAAAMYVTKAAGKTFSVTPADLAARTGLNEEQVARFCSCFASEFGSVGIDVVTPQVTHPLKVRPLVHDDGEYLAHLIGSLLWAIKPRFEEALKGTGRAWERFSVGRHQAVVKMTQECFAKILDPLSSLPEAYYPVADDQEAEVDLVARFDSSLFFVEVKAGSLREIEKKGVPGPLLDKLKELVRDPHEQALRALAYVQGTPDPVFRARTGEELAIPRANVRRCFLVTVVLEPLGHLFAHMTADSPELGRGTELPWVVSLLDLMAIADCLESYGPWFPLYLQRRQRILELRIIRTADELDLFMHFLSTGLYFEDNDDLESVDLYMLGTLTDPLDWYYFREAGLRSRPAPRPKPVFDAAVLRFVEGLRMSGVDGWSDGAIALIQLNEASRKKFTDNVARARKKSRKDGRGHNVTLHDDAGGNGGLSYYCNPSGIKRAELATYAARKRRELRLSQWVVVGDRGRRSMDVSCVVVDPSSCF